MLQTYAQLKNVSIEEALEVAIKQMQVSDKEFSDSLREDIEGHEKHKQKLAEQRTAEEKEKQPETFFMNKLTEYIAQSMNIPKQALAPPIKEEVKPFGIPPMDPKSFF